MISNIKKARSAQGSGRRILVEEVKMPPVETTPVSEFLDGSTTPNGHIPAGEPSQVCLVCENYDIICFFLACLVTRSSVTIALSVA
jgi:hypothetical protein